MKTEEGETVLQVRQLDVDDRGSEGWKRERGVSNSSCIVNEKFFTSEILFHCRPAEKSMLTADGETGGWINVMGGCTLTNHLI